VKSDKFGSAKKQRKFQQKKATKALDTLSRKTTNQSKNKRGRHNLLPPDTVTGHASNFEFQLNEVWERLEKPLLNSKTSDEVTEAFKKFAEPYDREFVPRLSSDILRLLNDPDFPQRPLPRTRFLARSLAGRSVLSFRRSRDICEKADREEKRKSPHRLLRREFYIECSCGYRGPALDDCCRKCGAEPPLSLDIWTGKAPEIPVVKKIRRIRKRVQVEPHKEDPVPTNPNTVQCECGATISASSREIALQALAEHRQKVHPEIVNQGAEERPK
jgi:hypothetical protein